MMGTEYTLKTLDEERSTPAGFFIGKKFIWKAVDYNPFRDDIPQMDRFFRLNVNSWMDWDEKKYQYFGIWIIEWLKKQGFKARENESILASCTINEVDNWLYYTYWTEKNRGMDSQKQAYIEEWLYENGHEESSEDLRDLMLNKIQEVDRKYELSQVEYLVPLKA